MRYGLLIGAVPLRDIAREDPIRERRAEILGLLKMVCQQFRLRRLNVAVIEILQHSRNTMVADLTAALEHAGIGNVTSSAHG